MSAEHSKFRLNGINNDYRMRYFLENLFTLQPQNLIPEVIWLGMVVYVLLLLACFHSLLTFGTLSSLGKVLWGLIVLLPCVGPIVYASYRMIISDSTVKELWRSSVPKI